MFTISHDYYGILGVSKDATEEEIRSQYKKLMKEHHPDQFAGLRKKYEVLGDQDLLEVIDEKIRLAEEMCKLLNEAFEVLIDPAKRRQYDNEIYEPAVAKPEVAISPTKLTFGTLTEGQRKTLAFTVENKGGPVASVNIDWENTKPDWGELVIEPDPNTTFPINVTVKVDTTGIPSGPKYEKVQVTVDGEAYLVEVYLAVVAAPVSTPVYATPTPTAAVSVPVGKTVKAGVAIAGLGCLGIFLLAMIGSAVTNSVEQARERARVATVAAIRITQDACNLQATQTQQMIEAAATARSRSAQTTEVAFLHLLQNELSLVESDPEEVVSIERIGGGLVAFSDCSEWRCRSELYGQYVIVNKSSYSQVTLSADDGGEYRYGICNIGDYGAIMPGQSVVVNCQEYEFYEDGWDTMEDGTLGGGEWYERKPCIEARIENEEGASSIRRCFDMPREKANLSDLVEISVVRWWQTGGFAFTGRAELLIVVDERVPYLITFDVIPTPRFGPRNDSRLINLWTEDSVGIPAGFEPGGRYVRHAIYRSDYVADILCFELSMAYAEKETVCRDL